MPAETTDFAQMGALAPEHDMFKPFVGTFRAEVKMWMDPTGDPHVSTGVMTNTLDLGGRFLHHVYKGDAVEGPFPNFEGRGYWGYNTTKKTFEGFWIDTACTFMQNETGNVDASGKVWNMVGEMTCHESGQTMKKMSVVTLQDNDHHKMEMFFESPEGRFKGMEINYVRE